MKVGLVLSGGGARGIMHLGVIKALQENNIVPSIISGTSAGAIVGSLYAHGHSVDEIFKIITKSSFFRSVRPAWTWSGLFSLQSLEKVLLKYLPGNDFSLLQIPFIATATNLNKGNSTYFKDGPLVPAVLASSCVPAIFRPVELNGSIYVDGGILDNLPVMVLKDSCDYVIGSHCNAIDGDFNKQNLKAIIERSLLMAVNGNTLVSKRLCDLVIEPPEMGKFSGMELNKAKEMMEIGYQDTLVRLQSASLQDKE